MRFTCRFENRTTGEQKDLISVLDPEEVAAVERVRRTEGDEIAQVTAAAIVLKSAYADLDALQWNHVSAPTQIFMH